MPVVRVAGSSTSRRVCRHLHHSLGWFLKCSRVDRPRGSLLAFALGNVEPHIRFITPWHSLFPPSFTRTAIGSPCGVPTSGEERYGLTVFRVNDRNGLGALCSPVALYAHDGASMRLHAVLRTFWFKPVSIFGLLRMTAFIEGSHLFTMPSILAPSPPNAGRDTIPLRFWCHPFGCGYIVRGLLTARYLAAVPRRILFMGQQVWSRLPPDNHSRDFHVATHSYPQRTQSTRAGLVQTGRASDAGERFIDLHVLALQASELCNARAHG